MIARLVGSVALAIWSGAALAQGASVEDVIRQQFDAFSARDEGRAFAFASPMIQGMFGTPEQFGVMVRDGYPMIWDSEELTFLGVREEGGRVLQRVMVRDLSGRLHQFDYEMIEGESGWRINGVFPVRPGPGV